MNRKLICQILNHEMMLATGCTEPAAIALTAAIAREQLDGELEHIKVRASANIIKNAMSAGIPGTNYTGINYAAALGAVCGAVDRQLRVVDDARPEDIERAAHLVENGYVDVRRASTRLLRPSSKQTLSGNSPKSFFKTRFSSSKPRIRLNSPT